MTRTGPPFAVLVFAGGAVLGLAAIATAQAPTGPELLIASAPLSNDSSDVACSAQGGLVVTWADASGIMARRYLADGTASGVPFPVNSTGPIAQFAAVASDAAGAFTVAWQTDFPGSIKARRFDAAGAPISPDVVVNTDVTGAKANADVASDDNGNVVVVWTSNAQDGSMQGVFGQAFDLSGAPVNAEFMVNTYTLENQSYPTISMGANGKFVVAWSSSNQDGSASGIFAQRYQFPDIALGGEFRVNSATLGDQFVPSVALDPAGNFVVVWATRPAGSPDIKGQRFDAAGAPRGAEFRVNSYTTGTQTDPVVTAEADGFVVAWMSQGQDGSGDGIFGQRYEASGSPRGVEFQVPATPAGSQRMASIASGVAGNFVVTWALPSTPTAMNHVGQRFGGLTTAPSVVDQGGNRVFEPGETVVYAPAWRNQTGSTQSFLGAASNLTGPGGPGNPTYSIVDGAADYGTVPNGATASCSSTGNCYTFAIGTPTVRPVLHWDATFHEDLAPPISGPPARALHVGDSFTDVPRTSIFYRFVETILHHNLSGGCGGGNFCPLATTAREQMAVFVLVAKEGSGYQPPACVAGSEMFADVPASSPFCRWIEELARRGVAAGCGGGNFCPLASVTREQMAVFALATRESPGYAPPACVAGAEVFADVPASSPFCRWVEELARRNIAGGCGGGNFCPLSEVTREQNSVFLGGTFGLSLY